MGETKQGEWTALIPMSDELALEIIVAVRIAEKAGLTRPGLAEEFWSRARKALFGSPAPLPCKECQGEDFGDCAGCGDAPVSAGNYEWNAEPSGHVYGGGAADA